MSDARMANVALALQISMNCESGELIGMGFLIDVIKYKAKICKHKNKWRSLNVDNNTIAGRLFDTSCVKVGKGTYGVIDPEINSKSNMLFIGNYCSIADEVKFLLSSEHNLKFISSYPFQAIVLNMGPEATGKGDITIDDDVWIGYRAMILSGVHIGQGAVVAAGTVVTKDVPPYAIVGGVPAKVIKYRFSPEVIEQLLKLDYSKLTDDMIRERIDDLYTSLEGKSPDQVKKLLEWFPKKS